MLGLFHQVLPGKGPSKLPFQGEAVFRSNGETDRCADVSEDGLTHLVIQLAKVLVTQRGAEAVKDGKDASGVEVGRELRANNKGLWQRDP